MSLWKIAWRSIQQRSLASTLTAFSMALGVTLVVAVLVLHGAMVNSFQNNNGLGYNLVVGAKGGKLQLVLNTVYYLSSPVENVPYSLYKEFTEGKYKEYTEIAVPVCLGDYYQKYRVIGTTPAMFDKLTYGSAEKYTFAEGRNYKDDEFFSAVIGATVARETGLKVGGKFSPTHGAPDGHEHEPFTVVGVLAQTGTPNDRGLFVNMEGFYLLENHAKPVKAESRQPAAGSRQHEEIAKHEHPEDEHLKHAHGDEHQKDAHHDDEHEHAAEKHDAEHHDEHKDKPAPTSAAAAKADAHKEHDEHNEHAEEHHEHAEDSKHKEHEGEHAEHDDEHAKQHDDHHEHAAGGHHDEHDHGHGGHGHHHHEPLPEDQREVTAVLVRTVNDVYSIGLRQDINEGPVAQAVLPVAEMTTLFDLFVTPLQVILLALTVLIVIVSGISILVSIYNSMSERRHEIAVMRALGAGRRTVMLIVLLESILLSLGGGLVGWLLGHALIAGLNPWIAAHTGVSVGFFEFVPYESAIIPGLIFLAALVGYLPAVAAYRTDVAKALTATP